MTAPSRSSSTAGRAHNAARVALLLCAAGAASGAAPHPHLDITDVTPAAARFPDEAVWIESASGLFRARGADRAQTIALVTLADDTLARLDRLLTTPIPRPPNLPVYLALHPAAAPDAEPVFVRRHLVQPWGVAHRMDVSGIERAGELRVRTELVRLLLDRWTAYRQPPAARAERPAEAPAGLVHGLALLLLPDSREQAVREARAAWMAGAETDPARLLGMDKAPAPPDDVLAAAAALWLQESAPGAVTRLLAGAAEGRAVTARRLAGAMDLADERAVARSWALWLAASRERRAPWARTVSERVARVREAASLDTALWPHPLPADLPERIEPEILLARRNEAWVSAVAAHLAAQVRNEPTGEPRALDEAAGLLEQALLDLRWPEPGRPWRWLPQRASTPRIARRLARAREELAALDQPPAEAEPGMDAATE